MIHQHDRFMVTFRAKRADDLKPEALWWVGRTFGARASWRIEEGAYAGQWAFEPDRASLGESGTNWVGWFPECEIVIVGDANVRPGFYEKPQPTPAPSDR